MINIIDNYIKIYNIISIYILNFSLVSLMRTIHLFD